MNRRLCSRSRSRSHLRGGNVHPKVKDAVDGLDASIAHTAEMKTVVDEIKEVVDEVKNDGGDSTEAMVEVFNHIAPDPEPYFDKTVLESEKTVADALAPTGASKAASVSNIKSLFDRMLDMYHDIGVDISQTADKVTRAIQGRNDHYTTCVVLHYVIKMRRDEARKMRAKLVADAEGAKTEIDMKRIVNTAARWGTAAHILKNTFKAVVAALFVKFVRSWIVHSHTKTEYIEGVGNVTYDVNYHPDYVTENNLFNTDPNSGLHPFLRRKTLEFVEAINGSVRKFMKAAYLI
jgi:hypothetical protein